MPDQEEGNAFQDAVAKYAAEDTTPDPQPPAPAPEEPEEEVKPPKPVVEGEQAEPPSPESEKPHDFVEFDKPEQKERFNKVFGYGKRLERELESARRELESLRRQPVIPPQPVVPQPQQFQSFGDPRPKLSEFDDADKWADALGEWSARKARYETRQEMEQALSQRFTQTQVQQQQERIAQEQLSKINTGRQKFGYSEFDEYSNEVANFVTPTMQQTLFQLNGFADVVVELGKNLPEAERISRLAPIDQIYELKALERKLTVQNELKTKQNKTPTKVETPGQGEPPKGPALKRLRQAASETGDLRDWAKVFEEMEA